MISEPPPASPYAVPFRMLPLSGRPAWRVPDAITVDMPPLTPTEQPEDDWEQRARDEWVAKQVADAGWPTDLVSAGVDVSGPRPVKVPPKHCPKRWVVEIAGHEWAFKCTVPFGREHARCMAHDTQGQLIAQQPGKEPEPSTTAMVPLRPSPRPREEV